MTAPSSNPPRPTPYLLLLAVGVVAIALLSYRSYIAQERVIEERVTTELRGIADLKAMQVAAWRGERLSDANVLVADSRMMPAVEATLRGDDTPEMHDAVSRWSEIIRASYKYASVALTDASGRIRHSTGTLFVPPEFCRQTTLNALRTGRIEMFDVGRSATVERSHLMLVAPVRSDDGVDRGAILLGIDPSVVLYPVTLRWPRISATGDVVLIRRDGNEALYLSNPRRQPGAAMTLHETLTNQSSPVVQAALGHEAPAHGTDATGTAVLSAVARVPESPWMVVAKLDESEAYAPLRKSVLVLVGVAATLMLALAAALGWVWRHQVSTYYRQQFESEAHHRALQERFDTERLALEDQLRQSQKLESIGRLAGGVAHDFNNLLTVINGYSDLLISRLEHDPRLSSLATQIRKAGERAASLTQQLLAFGRKQVIRPRPLSLNALIADSEGMLSRLVGDDIEVVIRPDARPDQITADPGQIQQVLLNLVVNAKDAMPGGGTLTIETASVDLAPDGPFVLLAVADTGMGMDEATRSHIFEPFFTTKEQGQGTGLGLSTVYGIVQQSNGFIDVSSVQGTGTTMKVFLPRTSAAIAAAIPEARHFSLRGSETVLVVEDQHDVRSLVARSLRGYGYRIIEAANGREALEASQTYRGAIDLLIADIVMPGMNGRELADRLVADQPAIKVLYMSGYSDDVLGERGVLDPKVAYLQKPFGPDELAARVRSVLSPFSAPANVLVVDDEEPIRSLFLQLLTPLGCNVLLAADGDEAIAIAREHEALDLVITDLVMPERDGIETIKAIRRRWPSVRIIAMSGGFGEQFLDVARTLGADAILTKPIDPSRLRDALVELFAVRVD